MRDNKDNEVKDNERITGRVYTGSDDINVGGQVNNVQEEKKFSAEYLRYLADLSYAQEEYEKAIDLYREAEDLAIRKNPILASFIQASIANTYAKLHEYDFSAQYYLRARHSMVGELQRNTENPAIQRDKLFKRINISFFIIVVFACLIPTIYHGGVPFVMINALVLPELMFAILVITVVGYCMVFRNDSRARK